MENRRMLTFWGGPLDGNTIPKGLGALTYLEIVAPQIANGQPIVYSYTYNKVTARYEYDGEFLDSEEDDDV